MATRVIYTCLGLALGGLGIGWHGRPADAVIVAAIRARSAEYARATITVNSVARNWPHEVFGTSSSQFLVTASVARPGGSAVPRCFGVEPGLAATAIAFGPYADWRCRYPF